MLQKVLILGKIIKSWGERYPHILGPTTNIIEEMVGLGCVALYGAPKPTLLSSSCDLAEPKVTV